MSTNKNTSITIAERKKDYQLIPIHARSELVTWNVFVSFSEGIPGEPDVPLNK